MRDTEKKEQLESLLVRNFSKCRVTDRIEVKESQGKVLQLCHSSGRVKIDSTKITQEGILAEGVIILKILYIIGNDEMPFYSMETMLPFTHVIEAKGITKDSVYFLQADLEQLSTTMADGDEIEVKAAVGLNVLVAAPVGRAADRPGGRKAPGYEKDRSNAGDHCIYGEAGGYPLGYSQTVLYHSG